MSRYTSLLSDGMKKRGHKVEVWSPKPTCFSLGINNLSRKWLSYVDQYILFPSEIKKRLKKCSKDTLFVFCDHALGPWIPLVADKPHIIHCHDFLAQFSGLGQIPENMTGWSGRKYQAYIRHGFIRGKNFISVSEKTRKDLHSFLPSLPLTSNVVYNGVSRVFKPYNCAKSRQIVSKEIGVDLTKGYIMHIGGNQWYKNRLGVIEIYNSFRSIEKSSLPMLMIGKKPCFALIEAQSKSPYKNDIHFITGMDDKIIRFAYSGATVFLFPSLAEGFGWPIAEAMASGCPVITTAESPMTEVLGCAGFLIPKKPFLPSEVSKWAINCANVVTWVVKLPESDRESAIKVGLLNVKRFDVTIMLDDIEAIYEKVLRYTGKNQISFSDIDIM